MPVSWVIAGAAGTATVMILGNICTRSCRFCAIQTGRPPNRSGESARVAESIARMNLQHAVITSVARDDLKDGGAAAWAATIRAIHYRMPDRQLRYSRPTSEVSRSTLMSFSMLVLTFLIII